MKAKKFKYTPDLAARMYCFFIGYEGKGAPSFHKFARSLGTTTEIIVSFRKRKNFDLAYRECQEIRRDYLIDRALEKRFDASFTKFLLTEDAEIGANEEDKEFTLHLEVKE